LLSGFSLKCLTGAPVMAGQHCERRMEDETSNLFSCQPEK